MHLVAIRREIYEKHPFVAPSLYQALCASKDLALEKMRYLGALRYMLPWLMSDLDEIDQVFGGDPWPYGIEPNRPTLEAALRYLYDQALIAARGCRWGKCRSGWVPAAGLGARAARGSPRRPRAASVGRRHHHDPRHH